MVHVTFYKTFDQRNVINKTLLNAYATTAELYDNTDIFNPELKLAWSNSYATDYNFFYIQEFNRYYFLDDVIAEPGGAARVKGSVDVLYTYKTSLGYDKITITRAYNSISTGGTRPTYIKDSKLPIKSQREIEVKEFQQETLFNLNSADNNSWNFVINVMGKDARLTGGD